MENWDVEVYLTYSHFWLMLVPKWLNCRISVHYATLRHPAFLPEFVTDMIVVNLSQPEPLQCVWNTHVVNNDATAIWRHHQYWQYLEISKIAHDPPPKMWQHSEGCMFQSNGEFCKILKMETFFRYDMSQIFYFSDVIKIGHFCSQSILKFTKNWRLETRNGSTSLTTKLLEICRKCLKWLPFERKNSKFSRFMSFHQF